MSNLILHNDVVLTKKDYSKLLSLTKSNRKTSADEIEIDNIYRHSIRPTWSFVGKLTESRALFRCRQTGDVVIKTVSRRNHECKY